MLNNSKSMSTKESDRDSTRQKVIETASKLFVEHGCKKITMDYIAMNMHISKRTIYELFDDKESLLILCVKQLVKQADDSWAIVKEKAKEPMVIMMLMMHSMNSFIATYAKLIDDIDKYYPSIRKTVFKERPIHNEDYIREQLTEAQNRNIIREDVDITIATKLLIHLAMLVNTLKDYDAASRSYIVSELTFNYLRGMMTVKAINDYHTKEEEFNKIINNSEVQSFSNELINLKNTSIIKNL